MASDLTVTAVQFRKALAKCKPRPLLRPFEDAIAGADTMAKIEWEYGPCVCRNAPWVEHGMTRLGFTPAEIDILFHKAKSL